MKMEPTKEYTEGLWQVVSKEFDKAWIIKQNQASTRLTTKLGLIFGLLIILFSLYFLSRGVFKDNRQDFNKSQEDLNTLVILLETSPQIDKDFKEVFK